jgi:hypothetical protein
VVLGDFRTGRTQLLYRLRDRIGRTQCQHIDLERSATTPERFYKRSSTRRRSRCRRTSSRRPRARRSTPTLVFLDQAAPVGGNEPRRSCSTKCSSCARSRAFPGLRTALRELLKMLATSRTGSC